MIAASALQGQPKKGVTPTTSCRLGLGEGLGAR